MKTLHFLLLLLSAGVLGAADFRVGVIGLDTSHAPTFARLLNDPENKEHVPGARIVAAFKAGSPDVAQSASRIERFTEQMVKTYGVKLYENLDDMLRDVDAVMILSVDGRAHLEQAKRVFAFRKPVYVDKPISASLHDAIAILQLARESGTPCFSSSSRRFSPGIAEIKSANIGQPLGVFSHGPATLEPHHPDLFWYGVHAVEAMYAVMGRGCQTVVRTSTPDTDIVTGVWADGRVGTVRGTRNAKHVYGLIAFGSEANLEQEQTGGYAPLVTEIVKFFRTGVSPVPPAETVEIFTFMAAADESKRRGGVPVSLAEVLAAAGGFDESPR